jgi:hypothetical protein
MIEITTAMEETETPGQCVSRRNLGKSNRVERGKDASHNIQNYTIASGFLQENFFRIFLSPCGREVYSEKYFLDPRARKGVLAGVLVL